MNTYLLTYDLKGKEPRISYTLLINEINKLLGKVERVQFSTWVVITTLTEIEIRNKLSQFLDENDSLLVVKFDAYASRNMNHNIFTLIPRAWNFMNLVKNRIS